MLAFLANFPNDSGPIYRETMEGRFPVEPFNTLSNLLFLAIVVYFSIKVYKSPKRHIFLAFAIPILFLGFVGGTLYHATRDSEIYLLMDWVPILVLCLSGSIYFAIRSGENLLQRILYCLLVFALIFGVRFVDWPYKLSTSIGYIGTALGILFPLFLYLIKNKFKYGIHILLSFISFGLAISFRVMDRFADFFTMGTHWLWHSFGAIAVFFLMNYIYLDKTKSVKNVSRKTKSKLQTEIN